MDKMASKGTYLFRFAHKWTEMGFVQPKMDGKRIRQGKVMEPKGPTTCSLCEHGRFEPDDISANDDDQAGRQGEYQRRQGGWVESVEDQGEDAWEPKEGSGGEGYVGGRTKGTDQ